MATTSGLNDWANMMAQSEAERRASAGGEGTSGSSGSSGSGFNFSGNFESTSDFPDWLKEPNMDELENEYGNVNFNINPFIKPIKRFANAQYSNALQTGANAADESIARSLQSGIVGPINTTVISAQAAMPALLAKMGANKEIAGLRINNMYKEQEARAALAAQIAGMRKSYVDTMARFAEGQGQLSLEAELGRGRLDLARDQFDFGQQQYEDQAQQSGEQTWEQLANVQSSWNAALGSGGAAINWQRFLSGLSPGTKTQTADFSLLGLA